MNAPQIHQGDGIFHIHTADKIARADKIHPTECIVPKGVMNAPRWTGKIPFAQLTVDFAWKLHVKSRFSVQCRFARQIKTYIASNVGLRIQSKF